MQKYDWKVLLQQVRAVFGEEVVEESEEQQLAHFGEVKVFVQMFFTIPMQVKLTDGTTEERVGLPDRFKESIMKVQMSAPNVVKNVNGWNKVHVTVILKKSGKK